MTRPTLVPGRDGLYRPELEQKLHDAMTREAAAPSRAEMALRAAGYFAATVLVGIGVLIGMIVVCGFAVVFWVLGAIIRKTNR